MVVITVDPYLHVHVDDELHLIVLFFALFAVSVHLCDRIVVSLALIIIIMYIYHALINALSVHMIHINLNMIFYTHVEYHI